MWLAAKYPKRVKSLSLRRAWTRTDPFIRVVVEGWQTMAQALGRVTRFADPLRQAIPNSELIIFEGCSHAPIYEEVEDFNARTLAFLQRHAG